MLLFLSRDPGTPEDPRFADEWNISNALELLDRVFPNLTSRISGKHILDFGCGAGWQCIAFAQRGAERVVGIDANEEALKAATERATALGLRERVEFWPTFRECDERWFDVVVSQNGMEHFGNPAEALRRMKAALKPGGEIFITFGPPWYAPYGSHMNFFTRVPWVNLWFSEQTVMKARRRFRDDGAARYQDVQFGLNKMTVRKFETFVSESGLKIRYRKYDCVKGLTFLGWLPSVRELFINHISCILSSEA